MNIKNFLIKIKEFAQENSSNVENNDFISSPIILPERGFVILKESPYFIRFDEEIHNDNLLKIIETYYPTSIDFKKLLKKDLNVCLDYLLGKGAIIFENHGLIRMNEYQTNPDSIHRSSGELYIPKSIYDVTGAQASILLKYMHDFNRFGKLDIVEVSSSISDGASILSLSLDEFEKILKELSYQSLKEKLNRK